MTKIFVSNVADQNRQSTAEAAMAEVRRLERVIANVNEFASICELPNVNRQDQATELRAHAAELEQQQQIILDQLASGQLPKRSAVEDTSDADNGQPGDEAPLVMRSVFDDAPICHPPAMNTDYSYQPGDESPLVMRSVFDIDNESEATTPNGSDNAEGCLVMPRMTY